jgi:hypothetical protein
MTAHYSACVASSALCDQIYNGLKSLIPNLERKLLNTWCALYEPGKTRLAYIQHRRTSGKVGIWCTGDLGDLLAFKKLSVVPRENFRNTWERRFPARFFVETATDVSNAIEILHKVSYPATHDPR